MATAKLEEAIDARITLRLDDVHTFFPAEIIAIRPDGLVDVKPGVKVIFPGTTEEIELPVINKALLLETRSEGAIIRVPKEDLIGSRVGVLISEHSLTEWRQTNGQAFLPEEARRFDINDAVALLGLYPEGVKWPVAQKPKTLEMQVAPGNKIGIGDGTNEFLKIMYDFLDFFQTVTATDGDTLAANLTTAQAGLLASLKTQLAAITNI
jgi:hypothetical protein